MGSLTLHLAHAIHGANPPMPPELRQALCGAPYKRPTQKPNGRWSKPEAVAADEIADPHAQDLTQELQTLYATYLASRRAVIHTLDINLDSSRAAHNLIRNFRRARYLPNVTFHVRTIQSYLSSRLGEENNEPFISHAVLDLPNTQDHADIVEKVLRPDGTLLIFCPSITQIADFMSSLRDAGSALQMERVVELPTSTTTQAGVRQGACGRDWDLRAVKPRAASAAGETEPGAVGEGDAGRHVVVCRPRAGAMVVGGGFVAVFRKMANRALVPERLSESPAKGGDVAPAT
jgi:hypothetical protein